MSDENGKPSRIIPIRDRQDPSGKRMSVAEIRQEIVGGIAAGSLAVGQKVYTQLAEETSRMLDEMEHRLRQVAAGLRREDYPAPRRLRLGAQHVGRLCTEGRPMSDEITPALTPDEWKEFVGGEAKALPRTRDQLQHACSEVYSADDNVNRHGLAALALYGHPFGFTQEDVALLHEAAALWPNLTDEREATIRVLAAKIAALLPPAP